MDRMAHKQHRAEQHREKSCTSRREYFHTHTIQTHMEYFHLLTSAIPTNRFCISAKQKALSRLCECSCWQVFALGVPCFELSFLFYKYRGIKIKKRRSLARQGKYAPKYVTFSTTNAPKNAQRSRESLEMTTSCAA